MSLCFDIGANVGNWSLANIKTFQYSKIISIEASPTTFSELLNNVTNVPCIVPLSYAVSSTTEGSIIFYNSSSNTLSTTNKDWLVNPKSRFAGTSFTEIKVPTTSIDKLISKYGIPDLIKIDVEGAEFDVIQSLTQKVSLLCFEWASELNDVTFKCLEYLNKLGFEFFFLQYTDNYTFRPPVEKDKWFSKEEICMLLHSTTPKEHWGMIWAA